MFIISRATIACAIPVLLIGCIVPRDGQFRGQTPTHIRQAAGETGQTIYVVGHGWHTGIVVNTDDLTGPLRPGFVDTPSSGYMEVGWGDEGFYRAKSINPGVVFRAVFTPTPSVMHLVRFEQHPAEVFVGSDVVELRITDRQFDALCRYVRDSFETDENGKSQYLSRGIYGDSAFYRGRGSYYYPKTCNVWTARALQAAGVPMVTALSTTAGGVIGQAKLHGRALRKSSPMAMIHALGIGRSTAD